ncbi:monocarboxylate transporter 13-like [Ruditapes philippinarum]|uniref:monocarboxylate transporter 13-like n=1 Tax=Ruditapes philippinarum TaxID=129788 RepID=UPI00295ACB37|nr:monocarboxylate transporter 13-like [Ruditapes philippinarum]
MYVRQDGGWGWIVAIATFLCNVIIDGVKYSFGIIFVELVNTFKGTKSQTSWIMSIQIGVMLLSGPVVAALVNRFGCRKIGLVGTVVSFSGFVASSFARSLYVMYITFGLLGGLGFGMMSMPMVVTLARYFDKRLALASGIAAMGSGFGTLVFNPLSKVLIDTYTWRGTLLIESGIVLNGLVCALVLKQPATRAESTNAIVELDTDNTKDDNTKEENTKEVGPFTELNHCDHISGICRSDDQELCNERGHENDKSVKLETYKENRDSASLLANDGEVELSIIPKGIELKQTTEEDPDEAHPLIISTDKIINGATYSENSCETCHEISLYNNKNSDSKLLNVDKQTDENSVKLQEEEGTDKRKRWFSLSPLKNIGFLFFLVSGFLIELALNVPFTFLPDMMLQRGFQKQDSVWMLFVIGLVSTVSRIVIGFIADLRFINRVKLCNSIVVLNGIIVVCCPFCFNYASFLAFSILFGFSAGSSSSLRYVLVPDLFGVDMIADLYGLNMFFCAFAAFVGLPKAGALFDVTGNYMVPFVVAGVELVVSGLLLFLIPVVNRERKASVHRNSHCTT